MTRVTDYDAVAAGYDVRYRNYDYGEIKDALAAFLGDTPLDAILDVGCGTGYWLNALAGRARSIVGVDRSTGMLQRARRSSAGVVQGRAEQLPFRDGSFDRIVCINALHHFDSRDAFFAESRRVLKPKGGLFNVGLDPHAEKDFWWIYDFFPETRAIDLERYAAVRTIRGELVRADFTWCESFEVQTFEHTMTAAHAFERGLVSRSFSSQLTVLSEQEFDSGVARLREGGDDLPLVSELHLYATIGWVG